MVIPRIIKACILFIPPLVFLIILMGNPFQNYVILTITTKLVATGAEYFYYYENNPEQHIPANNEYTVNQDDFEKSSISKTIINTIFGSQIGWYEICFHNINSTFILRDYNTKEPIPISFKFNNEEIWVLPQERVCNSITAGQKFSLLINNKFVKSSDELFASNFVKQNKEFLEYAKKNNIDITTITIHNWVPYFVGEVYATIHSLTFIVGYFIIIIVWAGIIFTILDIKKFLSK